MVEPATAMMKPGAREATVAGRRIELQSCGSKGWLVWIDGSPYLGDHRFKTKRGAWDAARSYANRNPKEKDHPNG